jgi:hypothetical protein
MNILINHNNNNSMSKDAVSLTQKVHQIISTFKYHSH